MMKITEDDERNKADYEACEGKQFGNLHERMKYLLQVMQSFGPKVVPNDLWHAVWDMETEVQYYTPVNPPYARRIVNRR